jgi:hypothetical protein
MQSPVTFIPSLPGLQGLGIDLSPEPESPFDSTLPLTRTTGRRGRRRRRPRLSAHLERDERSRKSSSNERESFDIDEQWFPGGWAYFNPLEELSMDERFFRLTSFQGPLSPIRRRPRSPPPSPRATGNKHDHPKAPEPNRKLSFAKEVTICDGTRHPTMTDSLVPGLYGEGLPRQRMAPTHSDSASIKSDVTMFLPTSDPLRHEIFHSLTRQIAPTTTTSSVSPLCLIPDDPNAVSPLLARDNALLLQHLLYPEGSPVTIVRSASGPQNGSIPSYVYHIGNHQSRNIAKNTPGPGQVSALRKSWKKLISFFRPPETPQTLNVITDTHVSILKSLGKYPLARTRSCRLSCLTRRCKMHATLEISANQNPTSAFHLLSRGPAIVIRVDLTPPVRC